jgi:hypothetical protein
MKDLPFFCSQCPSNIQTPALWFKDEPVKYLEFLDLNFPEKFKVIFFYIVTKQYITYLGSKKDS